MRWHKFAVRDSDGVAVPQPFQGRFLPRLRAAPSGVAFFLSGAASVSDASGANKQDLACALRCAAILFSECGEGMSGGSAAAALERYRPRRRSAQDRSNRSVWRKTP